jgi:hypothetical protein
MEVVLQLTLALALALQGKSVPGADTAALVSIERVLAQEGVRLVPIHPGSDDPTLVTWFRVDGVTPATAERIGAALRRLPGVTAAYIKPSAELP